MYDSVNISAIPLNAQMIGCYGDSRFMNVEAARTRFPHAVIVVISAAGTNVGVVGDCETGDLTPTGSVSWVQMRRAAGVDPTIYMNTSTWPAVRSAFQNARVTEPHYWVAQYDGKPVIPSGAIAKQYIDPPGSGGNYDLSVVADYWPGVDKEDTSLQWDQANALGQAKTSFAAILGRFPSQQEEFDFASALVGGTPLNTLCDQLQADAANPDVAPLQAPALLASIKALQTSATVLQAGIQALQGSVATLQAQVANLQQAGPSGPDTALRAYLRSGPQ